MPRPRPRREPCDCRDCLEDGESGAAAAAAALRQGGGAGFLDGIVNGSKEEPLTTTTTSASTSYALTGTRAARQDPPPRALVLLCDGMLSGLIEDAKERKSRSRSRAESGGSSASPSSSFPHLDAVARGGAVGTLALRRQATSAEADDPRLRRYAALFQLLGAHLTPPPNNKSKSKKRQPLSERFLGLSAALITTEACAAAAAEEDSFGGLDKVETFSVSLPPSPDEGEASSSSSSSALLASRVSSLLGIDKSAKSAREEGEEETDDGSFDLALVHLTRDAFLDGSDGVGGELIAARNALSFADSFLQKVRSSPGSLDDQGDDALISVVVFSGVDGSEEERLALALPPRGGAPLPLPPPPRLESSAPVVPRPAQSFEFAQGEKLDVKDGALLVASRCDGVLRVDGARRLLERSGGESCGERQGGNDDDDDDEAALAAFVSPGGTGLGCVLAEHLLDEIAYKIGRALKYGA